MKASVTTRIAVSKARMWAELQKVSSLLQVAAPVLQFELEGGQGLPQSWALGVAYRFRLRLFGSVPLGRHEITLVRIDEAEGIILSNERGGLARRWDHLIRVEPIDEEFVRYTDEIDLDAGLLTVPVWLFAHLFYRHRQRRWKKLLGG